jgi:hypothetical protein
VIARQHETPPGLLRDGDGGMRTLDPLEPEPGAFERALQPFLYRPARTAT